METTDIIKDLIAENRLEEAIELLNRLSHFVRYAD